LRLLSSLEVAKFFCENEYASMQRSSNIDLFYNDYS
jgi:hypothetical protein